jgi:hypothetical protein
MGLASPLACSGGQHVKAQGMQYKTIGSPHRSGAGLTGRNIPAIFCQQSADPGSPKSSRSGLPTNLKSPSGDLLDLSPNGGRFQPAGGQATPPIGGVNGERFTSDQDANLHLAQIPPNGGTSRPACRS